MKATHHNQPQASAGEGTGARSRGASCTPSDQPTRSRCEAAAPSRPAARDAVDAACERPSGLPTPEEIRERVVEVMRQEYPPAEANGIAPVNRTVQQTAATDANASLPTGHSARSTAGTATDAIPARMLNEFVYCPRLFYYEFVEGVFVENADTLRGKGLHRRVDTGNGALPPAAGVGSKDKRSTSNAQRSTSKGESPAPTTATDDRGEPSTINREPSTDDVIHSRSVQMGSARLGATAKMDLIEVRTGGDDLFQALEVCPVDYKAGAPREGDDGNELWDADKMQLGVQVLILRDNGYRCSEGVIYYRATKQRVRLPITPELEAWVVDTIARARAVATGSMPPPLANSPKCPRCSLVTVCLPDETRFLQTATAETAEEGRGRAPSPCPTPRRLIAARDDSRALYLTTQGLRVGRKGEVLQVKEERALLDEVRLKDVSHVALFGNIQISTQAVQALCEAEIPVTYFSMGGWFYGITRGHELKNVFLRIEQFRRVGDDALALELSRQFVHGKIRNHRTMLMRNHLEPPPGVITQLKQLADKALTATSREELLGLEGAAAAAYFAEFNGMLKVADELADARDPWDGQLRFNFEHRNRRPPTDPVNALLSLGYSLLAKDCTVAALTVGFDPYVGFYHQPRFGRPALALDVMEEFRPLVAESVALACVNNRILSVKDFVRAGDAVNLTAAGRKRYFQAYEQRLSTLLTHPLFDYKVSYRRALELQMRLLAKTLTGEIDEYVPLMTR